MYSTDPTGRADFIASLLALADYLARNPAIPVPLYGEVISVHADSTENGGSFQVDRIAKLLGAEVTDDTRSGGHYRAIRSFGRMTYEIVSIPETCMALHDALMSYRDSVIPDETQS